MCVHARTLPFGEAGGWGGGMEGGRLLHQVISFPNKKTSTTQSHGLLGDTDTINTTHPPPLSLQSNQMPKSIRNQGTLQK